MTHKFCTFFLLSVLVQFSFSQSKQTVTVLSTDLLKIHQLGDGVYVHETYLQTKNSGKVACNGLIYVNDNEAVVFDTPSDQASSKALIKFIIEELKSTIEAVVPTHFHVDCLGGLDLFHDAGIPSIANQATLNLAKETGAPVPQLAFEGKKKLEIGNSSVVVYYPGEGHTQDNVVGYIPDSNILFGGCLIKSLKAGDGNLQDANVEEWSNTVSGLKKEFPNAKVIVPGHGVLGGVELLDYTINKFKER